MWDTGAHEDVLRVGAEQRLDVLFLRLVVLDDCRKRTKETVPLFFLAGASASPALLSPAQPTRVRRLMADRAVVDINAKLAHLRATWSHVIRVAILGHRAAYIGVLPQWATEPTVWDTVAIARPPLG